LGCVANRILGEYTVKHLALTAFIASVFTFITTASGEVLRSQSALETTDQAAVTPVASATTPRLTYRQQRAEAEDAAAVVEAPAVVVAPPTVVSATTTKLTYRQQRAQAEAAAVEAPPAVVVAPPTVVSATTTKLTYRQQRAESAAAAVVVEPVPAVVSAPVVPASVTTPRLTFRQQRAEAEAAAAALADVTPLFLPPTPDVTTTLTASGETTAAKFTKPQTVISTPEINLNPVPFSPVPEPASTSLVLLGLFGPGVFFVRRYQARQA
jgi:hypothetical protein